MLCALEKPPLRVGVKQGNPDVPVRADPELAFAQHGVSPDRVQVFASEPIRRAFVLDHRVESEVTQQEVELGVQRRQIQVRLSAEQDDVRFQRQGPQLLEGQHLEERVIDQVLHRVGQEVMPGGVPSFHRSKSSISPMVEGGSVGPARTSSTAYGMTTSTVGSSGSSGRLLTSECFRSRCRSVPFLFEDLP